MAMRDTNPTRGKHARPASADVQSPTSARVQRPASVAAAATGKRNPWRVVFVAALLVFIASILALGLIFFSYWKERNAYSDIADEVFDASAGTLANLKVDWDALKAQNPDTVAWIYVPDTQINYPIVYAADNDKYLKTNFQGETNWVVSVGAIFLEATNSTSFSDANTIIYGHNMNDGSMFSVIADFADESIFNAHRNVYILTPAGNYRIKTFSLIHTSGYDTLVQTAFGSDAARISYIEDKLGRSVVSASGGLPAAGDMTQIFTFSTCDNNQENARYVLFGFVAESTVPGVTGLEQVKGVSRNAASAVNASASDFAAGNDVGD